MPFANFLNCLRPDFAPVRIFDRFHPEVGNMAFHAIEGDVSAEQPIVTFLQGGEVIPEDARNVNRIVQRAILL